MQCQPYIYVCIYIYGRCAFKDSLDVAELLIEYKVRGERRWSGETTVEIKWERGREGRGCIG
jgi:hypothetical protein